jgi:hypothetical protein
MAKYRSNVSQTTKLVRQKVNQSIFIVGIVPPAREKAVCQRLGFPRRRGGRIRFDASTLWQYIAGHSGAEYGEQARRLHGGGARASRDGGEPEITGTELSRLSGNAAATVFPGRIF